LKKKYQIKNILFLHSSSDLYGASKILLNILEILKQEGYSIFVCLPENGPLIEPLYKLGVNVKIFELGILRRKYFSVLGIINRLIFVTIAIVKLAILIKTRKIDVVYSNTTAVIAGVIAAKISFKPHFYHVHEIITKPKLLITFLRALLFRFSDKIIVVSNEVKKCWLGKYNFMDKLIVIYNGIDVKSFVAYAKTDIRKTLNINEDIFLIGMIARVHYWKGQKYFVEIASHILHNYKNCRFVMVGDAFPGYEYLYNEIAELIKELKIEKYFYNLGYRDDISAILKALDIFVLPSILPDPLPTTVLEAMAASKPVIATNHGGAIEMIEDNITGILIPFNDPFKAFKKIEPLLKDKKIVVDMGLKGKERVESIFSREKFNKNILNLFANN